MAVVGKDTEPNIKDTSKHGSGGQGYMQNPTSEIHLNMAVVVKDTESNIRDTS